MRSPREYTTLTNRRFIVTLYENAGYDVDKPLKYGSSTHLQCIMRGCKLHSMYISTFNKESNDTRYIAWYLKCLRCHRCLLGDSRPGINTPMESTIWEKS